MVTAALSLRTGPGGPVLVSAEEEILGEVAICKLMRLLGCCV
jgi:hypothetical protein